MLTTGIATLKNACLKLPVSEIASAETDEKEVSVISDRKAVSSDGKDDLVSQLPQDFIAPTAKKMILHIPEEYQLKMKNRGCRYKTLGTFI